MSRKVLSTETTVIGIHKIIIKKIFFLTALVIILFLNFHEFITIYYIYIMSYLSIYVEQIESIEISIYEISN